MTTELAPKPDHAALIKSASPITGVEGMDDKDAALPFLLLLQDKATVLKNMQRAKVPAVPGQFALSSNEKVALDSVEFVPAYMTKKWTVVRWQGDKREYVGTTYDINDPLLKGKRFKKEVRKTADGDITLKAEVNEVITVVAIIDGFPAVVNFKATSYQTGKELYTLARKAGGPLWQQKYKLTSQEVQAENPYYVMAVEAVGPASEADQQMAYQVYEGFKGRAGKLTASEETIEETPF